MTDAPAGAPCKTCPYRQDAPSGLWASEHYEILPEYDKPMFEQPPNVFGCHKDDGRLCAGWVATHDMSQSLALRLGCTSGRLTPETVEVCVEYETSVPVFSSGAEACAHGMRDIENPSEEVRKIALNLLRRVPGTRYDG